MAHNNAETQGTRIPVIFQEPLFTTTDKTFLAPHGTVVDVPAANIRIGPNTLLFGIHLYRPIYAAALTTLPAIYIGTGWDVWDG